MSIHGACHDNGNAGRCDLDCEVYIDGECPVWEEVWERCSVSDKMKCGDRSCKHYDTCDTDGHNCDNYHDPAKGCSNYKVQVSKQNMKEQLKQTRNEPMNDNKFDFDKSTAQVKGNAVTAVDTIKNVVVQMQQGKAVLAGVKSALIKAPGMPDGMKVALATPYGDMIIGLILHTMAPVLTGSPMILKAVKAANVAGAVEVSSQFTFIQDAIESTISSIPGFEDMKAIVEEKVGKVASADYTMCPNCENMFKESAMTNGLCNPCYNGLSTEEQAEMSGV